MNTKKNSKNNKKQLFNIIKKHAKLYSTSISLPFTFTQIAIRHAFKLVFIIIFAVSTTLISCGAGERQAPTEVTVDPSIRALHNDLFVMDMHVDSMLHVQLYGSDFSVAHRPPSGFEYLLLPQADLPNLIAGGTDAVWFGIVVLPACIKSLCLDEALNSIALTKRVIRRNKSKMALALSTEDVKRIHSEGKIPSLMGLEGAHGLGGDIDNLTILYDEGVRYIGLTHFTANSFAWPNIVNLATDKSLTRQGKELVRRMNRLGMIIDLAHVHTDSIRDALEISQAPIIVSHTGVKGIHNVSRNISDEDIISIAEKGGVIGILFAREWLAQGNHVTTSDVADHIDYVKNLVGIDHVGIGSDYDGFIQLPIDLPNAAFLPILTEQLVARGYSVEKLEKLYGGNAMRVFGEVEKVARDLTTDQKAQ